MSNSTPRPAVRPPPEAAVSGLERGHQVELAEEAKHRPVFRHVVEGVG
jgi:hypothetical protein